MQWIIIFFEIFHGFTNKLATIWGVNLALPNSPNQDETKKEPTPPKQIPYSQRKKSSATGEAPGAANGAGGDAGEPGEMFKMPKKKSVQRKPIEKKEEEAPGFAGMKLKKAERVQRKWDDDKMESVDLKHHEFEKEPLEEGVSLEMNSLSGPG